MDYCVLQGTLDDTARRALFASDLETDIRLGVFDAWDPASSALVFHRRIVDLKNYINHPSITNFMEITYNEIEEKMEQDTDSQKLSEELVDNLTTILPKENIHNFSVLWKHDSGIHPILHKDYLKEFCDKALASLTDLIDLQAHAYQDVSPAETDEVLVHWLACRTLGRPFIGREHELEVIRNYVVSNSDKVLVLFGEPGAGKTSLVAQAASQMHIWVEGDVVVIPRFLGSTANSFDVRQLLYHICRQILLAQDKDPDTVPKSFKDIQQFFHDLLDKFPNNQNLVILLDALDMLVPQYNAYSMKWLPKQLKENVKIIVSTQPDSHGILHRLQEQSDNSEEHFLDVSAMSVEECKELLSCLLAREGRQISPAQYSAVEGVFEMCALPFYVKLLAEDAKTWTSSSSVAPVMLPTDIRDYINSFLDRLELRHGNVLVSKALGYLTASTTGLGDGEMEDILSLDDDVLSEVFKDTMPSSRRLPPLMWLRLKSDLSNFLIQKQSEDTTVNFWYHRQFVEASRQRYLADEENRKTIHAILADYFLGTWHNQKKPYMRQIPPQVDGEKPVSKLEEADRLVVSQPLTFTGAENRTRYNKRKYEQVPRHLFLSGRLQELNQLVLFSYEWIYNKMTALTLEHVLTDFVLNPGVEATLVERALRDAQPFIIGNTKSLAPELSGRLLSYYKSHTLIRGLIDQCDKQGLEHCAMLPAFSYHQVPGSPLKSSLECRGVPTHFALVGEHSRYLLVKDSNSSVMQRFDLAAGEHIDDVMVSVGDLKVTPSGRFVVLVEHIREMAVKVHDMETGMFIGQFIPTNHITPEEKPTAPWRMTDVCVSDSHLCVVMTADESYLCIAATETCAVLSVISLGARASVCQITPDSSHVFCNARNTLLSFSLNEFEQVAGTELVHKPSKMIFSGALSRGFMINQNEAKLYVLHVRSGAIDFMYKVAVTEYFPDDRIVNLKLSNGQSMLLLIGFNNLLVYSTQDEAVMSYMPRPNDMPKEFKLPKAFQTDICFTDAEFSPDDKFLMASIFRNVYIWQVDSGRLLTTLQAPVGIVKHLIVPSDRGQIVTHMENANDIQIWSLGDAISHMGSLDRLTSAVRDIEVTADDKLAYVMCDGSDEVGVLDLQTGRLVDLLTHDSTVLGISVSRSGELAVVTTSPIKPNITNKVWSMKERKMLYEFGSAPAYSIAMKTEDCIICVYQQERKYRAPWDLVIFSLNRGELEDFRWPQELPFVLTKPFLTPEDRYLVLLTADDYDPANASYMNPTICAVAMKDQMTCTRFQLRQLVDNVVIRRILHVRPYSSNPYTVIALFTSEPDDFSAGVEQKYDHCYGFLILDICSGILCQVIRDFLAPDTPVDHILFNADASICLDDRSNLFDMSTGYFVRSVQPEDHRPRALAADGKVALYYTGPELYAVRLTDGRTIGRCHVHGQVCCLKVCHDDRTVVVGCSDGSLLAYVVLDPQTEDVDNIIKALPSRQLEKKPTSDLKRMRSWDKVNGTTTGPPYSRPTSAMSLGPSDRQLLKGVKPVARFRPTSDTFLYMNTRSKTCAIQ